jgi:diguanylate cyclase (GGDEF)-like protein
VLDLDHFKSINDTFGHAAGDRVLVEVAARLARGMRTTDMIARYGGEEFAILFPQTNRAAAAVRSRRYARRLPRFRCSRHKARSSRSPAVRASPSCRWMESTGARCWHALISVARGEASGETIAAATRMSSGDVLVEALA